MYSSVFVPEHHHQGKGDAFLMPLAGQEDLGTQSIRTRERLGSLPTYHTREAA